MKKISTVDVDTINLICQSQVITDVTSCIRELIANAIDAQASLIEVMSISSFCSYSSSLLRFA
jgi:DNA mismatch repair ATPase MutL